MMALVLRSQRSTKRFKIHPVVGLDIYIDGSRAAVKNGIGHDSTGEPRSDHLVPFTNSHGRENRP